jgi:SAM-dependent methyltransferase
MTHRACPICDHRRALVLHSQRLELPDDQQTGCVQDVVVCQICGGAFADTSVTQGDYDRLYAQCSRYAAGPAAHANDNDRDIVRFREMAAAIAAVLPRRSTRIVDVGCANGQMLAALSELGYDHLCGIDPSPGCVAQARAIPGVAAVVGSLSEISEPAEPYELAILSHVLEHVRDIGSALRHLKRFLAADACLYVEVPDAARYVDFAWSPFQDFNTEHINHFSLLSLANLLRQCGFRPMSGTAKEILSAPGMPYPAIYWFAAASPDETGPLIKDVTLKERLDDYVRVSRELLDEIDCGLARGLSGGERVIVWGTGELTAKLLVDTALARANIVGFVDGNPVNQGRRLRGLPIRSPFELTSGTETIVVASILHHEAIVQSIRARGLQNPVLGLGRRGNKPGGTVAS